LPNAILRRSVSSKPSKRASASIESFKTFSALRANG
jgi:hypothetical protein